MRFFLVDPKITGDFFRENRTCQRSPTLHIGGRIVHFEIFSMLTQKLPGRFFVKIERVNELQLYL